MASQVEICNIALANIHASGINSLDEASKEAQYCKLKFEYVLKFVTRKAQWNFAHKQVGLALVETDLFSWVYAYQYPSDCLKINYLLSSANRLTQAEQGYAIRPHYYNDNPLDEYGLRLLKVPYEVISTPSNKLIGANESNLSVDYQSLRLDPNTWDASFTMAFVWFLSAEIAVPILGGDNGRAHREEALSAYAIFINEALAQDANEQYNGRARESDTILVRR
jgi:hypothetical protein